MSYPDYKNTVSPLTKVIEECSEVIKAACKIDRFGWDNFHPDDPLKTPNVVLIRNEMSDVIEAFKDLEKYIEDKNGFGKNEMSRL